MAIWQLAAGWQIDRYLGTADRNTQMFADSVSFELLESDGSDEVGAAVCYISSTHQRDSGPDCTGRLCRLPGRSLGVSDGAWLISRQATDLSRLATDLEFSGYLRSIAFV